MKGDFTRDTFDPANHFSRVLMQQGRVTVDADQNEQTAILLHQLRTLAQDLIGPYAAPIIGGGFQLGSDENGALTIGAGRYYVDGILVENDDNRLYTEQPDYPIPDDDPLVKEKNEPAGNLLWLYLDVWERHITWIENDSIREKALGGPDTCTRAQVVWQVKAIVKTDLLESGGSRSAICEAPLADVTKISKALLSARVDPGQVYEDPCVMPPDAKYRGAENHLYRVEIHQPGKAGTATFKWSRDNGSVVTAWLGTQGNDLQVANTRGFSAGSWVELSDDTTDLHGKPGVLVKLTKVEGSTLSVDPASVPTSSALAWSESLVKPKVRLWNQVQVGDIVLNAGAVPVEEASAESPAWIDLEDGIQIQFSADGDYRTGDYWLIPARVATGNIEWPSTSGIDGELNPQPLPPRGIEHHYAPLGFVMWRGRTLQIRSCRCDFEPLSSCFSLGSVPVGAHLLRPREGGVLTPITRKQAAPAKKSTARKKKPSGPA